MNYRQWKKNYKKKHGHNPPLEEDKRKQIKVFKKAFRQIKDINIPEFVKGLANTLAQAIYTIGKALISVGEALKIK